MTKSEALILGWTLLGVVVAILAVLVARGRRG